MIPKINSAHGSDTRNILNRAIDLINVQGKSIQNLVANGQLTPTQYATLLQEVNGLIAKGEITTSDLNKSGFKLDGTFFTSDFIRDLSNNEINTTNVLPQSIGQIELMDKAVPPAKTTFMKRTKNLFNGSYYPGFINRAVSSYYYSLVKNHGDFDGRTAIVPIKPGVTYTVSVVGEHDIFSMATTNGYPVFGAKVGDEEVNNFIFSNANSNQHTFTNDSGDSYLIITVSTIGREPMLQVVTGNEPTKYEAPFYLNPDLVGIEKDSLKYNSFLNTEWEIGSLGIEQGEEWEVSSPNRVRSEYVDMEGKGRTIEIVNDSLYEYRVFSYGSNKRILNTGKYITDGSSFSVSTNVLYIRVLIKKKDNSDITDLKEINNLIKMEITLEEKMKNLEESFNDEDKNEGATGSNVVVKNYISPDILPATYPSNSDGLYSLYDVLVADFPESFSKSKVGEVAGNDINTYTFKPYNIPEISSMYNPANYINGNIKSLKILITSGVHGNEKGSTQAVYNFFNQLCRNGRGNSALEYLKANVEFVVMPIANPTGYNRSRRLNDENADLNRNFGNQSQIEQQILKDFFDKHSDADFYIDSHNTFSNLDTLDDLEKYIMMAFVADDKIIKNITSRMSGRLLNKWKEEYSGVRQAAESYYNEHSKVYPIGYVTPMIDSTISQYVEETYAIKSILLELQYNDPFNSGGANTQLLANCSLEIVTNTLLELSRSLNIDGTQQII